MNITLTMPDWAQEFLAQLTVLHFPTLEERMRLALRFARKNFECDTGGPFAAAVFERDSGKLLAVGVNRVTANNCSSAHAEIMALSLAQKAAGTYDLGAVGQPPHQLVVNWRPCAMCFGAVLWSGVRSLVIAGSGPELEAFTGFDEGPLHPEWSKELHKRGIQLDDNVLREESISLFRSFRESGKFVYNARQGAVSGKTSPGHREALSPAARKAAATVLIVRRRVQKKARILMRKNPFDRPVRLNNFHGYLPGGYKRRFDDDIMNEVFPDSQASKKFSKMTLAEVIRDIDRTIIELGLDPMEIIRLIGWEKQVSMYKYILPIYIRMREKGYSHLDLTA